MPMQQQSISQPSQMNCNACGAPSQRIPLDIDVAGSPIMLNQFYMMKAIYIHTNKLKTLCYCLYMIISTKSLIYIHRRLKENYPKYSELRVVACSTLHTFRNIVQ